MIVCKNCGLEIQMEESSDVPPVWHHVAETERQEGKLATYCQNNLGEAEPA